MLGVSSLIIPVRHNDCENFLAGIQYSDFSEYAILAREFYQSSQGAAFERQIIALTEVVTRAVLNAPLFARTGRFLTSIPIEG